jgi:hypothetical protein
MKIHKKRCFKNNISWCNLKEDCDKVVMVSIWKYVNCKECFEACLNSRNDIGYANNSNSKLSASRWYEVRKKEGELR